MANRFKVPIRANVDSGQLRALMERLQSLDKKASRPAIRKGLHEVTKDVLGDARGALDSQNVRRTGILRRALGRKVIVQRGGKRMLGIVKPRSMAWVDTPPNFVQQWKQKKTKLGKTKFWAPKYRSAGRVVNPARYAHLVEFGRVSVVVKMKKVLSTGVGGTVFGTRVKAVQARPFMRPAWDKNEHKATATIRRHLSIAVVKSWLQSRAKVPKAKR